MMAGLTLSLLIPVGVVAITGQPAHAAPITRVGDWNGDGRTDAGTFRPANGYWSVAYTGGSRVNPLRSGWGIYGDEVVNGDYDGDGRADAMVFRPRDGSWSVAFTGGTTTAVLKVGWGIRGDIPVPGDYNGDGRSDMMVFRRTDGSWSVAYAGGGTAVLRNGWGMAGDIPVSGDYNGDGRADMAVWRPRDGSWSVAYSSGGSAVITPAWGSLGDIPVPGDFNGDGKSDAMFFRPSTGSWYVWYTSGGYSFPLKAGWGIAGDQPVPGDFDGDGRTDMAVMRPSDGSWSVAYNRPGGGTAVLQQGWGVSGDVALPAATIAGVPARTYGADKTVLFVHGYDLQGYHDCLDYWGAAINAYRARGWASQYLQTVGYYGGDTRCDRATGTAAGRNTHIDDIGRDFAWMIYNNFSRYGRPVDVVAHSMGGLITRVAIAGIGRGDFPPYLFVEDVSTLATPHGGAFDGMPCIDNQCGDMDPDSPFYANWIRPYPNPQATGATDWTAIGSRDDVLVLGDSAMDLGSSWHLGHKTLYLAGQGVTHSAITDLSTGGYAAVSCDWTASCNMSNYSGWTMSYSKPAPVQVAASGSLDPSTA
ncbi:FG-GAP-like repeat-containing protein [Micromonospora sp. NBC_01796]|uniref:FG-GAP-like repeat-containing protein n=1 Tax=Micromonospora sp. NBC_01796 TaxID=2975987 RepID=UPI002DDC2A13|nr:FG-GAP-like repeat-containing protein [Micromonospora sp. NBC_01796]WSA85691.1 FG-GAP-like repeat-containing protein [Micromonospora sp. NBC_01796]